MNTDSIISVDPPGSLRKLLQDEDLQGFILVSEVHRCSSYARFLSASTDNQIYIGLSIEVPPLNNATVNPEAKWISSSYVGNFKTKSSQTKDYTPLYRLVSLKEGDETTGIESTGIFSRMLGGKSDPPPLPDAPLPWVVAEKNAKEDLSKESETAKGHGLFGKLRAKNKGEEPMATVPEETS
jgi:hypothetical protein